MEFVGKPIFSGPNLMEFVDKAISPTLMEFVGKPIVSGPNLMEFVDKAISDQPE